MAQPNLGRILVVEDESDLAESLESNLTRHHYEVRATTSPEQGLKLVAQGNYDLLLSDLMIDRKSTRLNSSHIQKSRMPSSA